MARPRIPNQKIIEALLTEKSIIATAKKAGVSVHTVYNRLDDPQFKKELRRRQTELVDASMRSLQKASTIASETLVNIMTDPDSSNYEKMQCANSILSKAFSAYEMTELVARLEELENNFRKKMI